MANNLFYNRNLEKLNHVTKYPSIPTYHKLGEKGILTPELNVNFDFEEIYITEKIDGTNTRCIVEPNGNKIIGSREQLFYHSGDLLYNPSMGIVKASLDYIGLMNGIPDALVIWYYETYGGKINNWKNYTSNSSIGIRIFDIAIMPIKKYFLLEKEELETISNWRENGGVNFLNEDELKKYCFNATQLLLPIDLRVPKITTPDNIIYHNMPKRIGDTYEFLENYKKTQVMLTDGARGCSEGIVIRNYNRTKIAKLRFEDYEKTLNRREK